MYIASGHDIVNVGMKQLPGVILCGLEGFEGVPSYCPIAFIGATFERKPIIGMEGLDTPFDPLNGAIVLSAV